MLNVLHTRVGPLFFTVMLKVPFTALLPHGVFGALALLVVAHPVMRTCFLVSSFAVARIVRPTDYTGSTDPRHGKCTNQRLTRRGENPAGDCTDGVLLGA